MYRLTINNANTGRTTELVTASAECAQVRMLVHIGETLLSNGENWTQVGGIMLDLMGEVAAGGSFDLCMYNDGGADVRVHSAGGWLNGLGADVVYAITEVEK